MVDRYSYLTKSGFVKCGGGEYIRYSDYADLEAKLAEALKIAKPSGKRPCDCDRCYCGNIGDAELVSAWDEQNTIYLRILSALEATPTAPKVTEAKWRYEIKYGPEGEANYAFVYDDGGNLVSNLRVHHAIAVVAAMNATLTAAQESGE